MNQQRLEQATSLINAVLAGFDQDDRMDAIRELGRSWATVLNGGHTPKGISEHLRGMLPYEVAYLLQTVVSNSKDHEHASMGLTVITNMAKHGG